MPLTERQKKLFEMMNRGGTASERANAARKLQQQGFNTMALVPASPSNGALVSIGNTAAGAAMAAPHPAIKAAGAIIGGIVNNWDSIKDIAGTVYRGGKKAYEWFRGKFSKKKPKPKTPALPAPSEVLSPAVMPPGASMVVEQSLTPQETMVVKQASMYPTMFSTALRHPNRSYESSLPLQSSLFTSARRRMGSNLGYFNNFVSPGRYRVRRTSRIY